MTSQLRSTWTLAGLLILVSAGCSSSNGSGDGAGGSGSGGAKTSGTGGTTQGTGGSGSGGSGSGGAADGGASDGGTPDNRNADAGDTRAPDGASGDARDGGGDATPPFAPCPADGGACVVMPLGDSITEGAPDYLGGYRVELFHQANLASKNITFVGRRSNGPASGMVDGKPFPRGNEGYSGFTIAGISGQQTTDAINLYHPHVILLAIGTNDINGNFDVANAPARLAALIDQITSATPSTLLVVAQIIPTRTDTTNARIQTYNSPIPALVQTRANAGKHVLLVDMYGTYTANANYKTALLSDDLHPNPAGYALMGQTWYGVIAPYLR
ncbi:MAG TPA: SGNH/GDSL hydrolase family protein [Polyangia bacterium]|jgi:lysophospholipase L1-like esterase|nr:SGNH/GDSL hydrolase family protein [Polyangia bacterium]